jgi:hypothetical protein
MFLVGEETYLLQLPEHEMTTVTWGRHLRHRQIVTTGAQMEGMVALVDKMLMLRVVAVRRR